MALDALVDSTQLNNDLEDIADAIRAKSGSSSLLAFPSGFVSEIGNIQTGGSSYPVTVTMVSTGTINAVKNAIQTATGKYYFVTKNLTETAPADTFFLYGGVYYKTTVAGYSMSIDYAYRITGAGQTGSQSWTVTGSTSIPAGTQFQVWPI